MDEGPGQPRACLRLAVMGGCELSLQNVQLCGGRHRVGGEVASELS